MFFTVIGVGSLVFWMDLLFTYTLIIIDYMLFLNKQSGRIYAQNSSKYKRCVSDTYWFISPNLIENNAVTKIRKPPDQKIWGLSE